MSFVTGLLLALSTSGGILWERLSRGDPSVVVAVGCSMTFTASLLLVQTRHVLSLVFRPSSAGRQWSVSLFSLEQQSRFERVYRLRSDSVAAAQLFGALAGASIVYAVTRVGPFAEHYWLSARPELLVNDAVAIVSFVVFVWALAENLDTALLVGVLLLMTAFNATAQHWCVEHAIQLFSVTVQRALVIQFGIIALCLLMTQRDSLRAG